MERKLAIFSDIHGNFQALEAILKDIKEKEVEGIYCLGDVISIGPNPKECMELIIKNNIKMVLGNHDLYYIKGTEIDDEMDEDEIAHAEWTSQQLNDKYKEYLDKCPLQIKEEIGEYKLAFQHFLFNPNKEDSYPFDDISIVKDNSIKSKMQLLDADITFIGHEHQPFKVESNNKKVIDIGSSGCTKDDNTFYTLVSIKDDDITIDKVNIKYNRKEFEDSFNNTFYPDRDRTAKRIFGINN